DALHRGIEAGVEESATAEPQLLERVGAGERLARHVLCDFRLELFEDGPEQVVLGREVVVQRAACDAGTVGDLCRGRRGVTVFGKDSPREGQGRGPSCVALLPLPAGHRKLLPFSSRPKGAGSARPVATRTNASGSPVIFSPPPPMSITSTP